MLYNIVGRTGSGKTTLQSILIVNEIDRINKGKSKYQKIALNSTFTYGEHKCYKDKRLKRWVTEGPLLIPANSLQGCFDMRNTMIHFDEGGVLFNSREWKDRTMEEIAFLTTHRHNADEGYENNLFVYTQHNDLVEVTFRRIACQIFLIRPYFGFPNKFHRYWWHKVPMYKLWRYTKHEVLEGKVPMPVDERGVPIVDKDMMLEELRLVDWFWIGDRYRKTFDTHEQHVFAFR